MEKLIEGDFLYSFYLAPGGSTFWLLRRSGEFFVQAIMGMQEWSMEHWPLDDEHISVSSVGRLLRMMGFREYPVYKTVTGGMLKKDTMLDVLKEQFAIYEQTKAQIAAERKAALEKQNQAPVNAEDTGDEDDEGAIPADPSDPEGS